jgi:hypothetical protein
MPSLGRKAFQKARVTRFRTKLEASVLFQVFSDQVPTPYPSSSSLFSELSHYRIVVSTPIISFSTAFSPSSRWVRLSPRRLLRQSTPSSGSTDLVMSDVSRGPGTADGETPFLAWCGPRLMLDWKTSTMVVMALSSQYLAGTTNAWIFCSSRVRKHELNHPSSCHYSDG